MPSEEELLRLAESIPAEQEQICRSCDTPYPLNEGYFNRDPSMDTGFMDICKPCRSKERRQNDGQKLLEVVSAFEARSVEALLETIEEEGSKFLDTCPHLATTFEELVHIFGGPGGYAKHVYAQYLSSKPGSAGRTKILQMIASMNAKVTELGEASIPTELLSDEELEAELEKRGVPRLRIAHEQRSTG